MSGITGNVVFSGGCVCGKNDAIVQKKRKNIICLMCVGHMMHMKHMKFEKGFFERTAGANAFQRMGYELLPPPADSFHRLRAVPLPRRGRGTAAAVEGVRTRCFYAEYLFSSDTHRTHEAYEAYEV